MGAWPSMRGRRHGVAFFGWWLLQLICEMVGIFRFWTIDICRDHELGTRFTRWNGVPDISFWRKPQTGQTGQPSCQETSILATLDVIAIYSLATGVLVVSSFWQFRTSHAMLLIVNSWSASLLRGDESCIQSKKEPPLQVVKIELKEVLGADQLFKEDRTRTYQVV